VLADLPVSWANVGKVPNELQAIVWHGGLPGADPGYSSAMTSHPHQAASDEADTEKLGTPAGVVGDLEELAEANGASTDPLPPKGQPPAQ
jgi:hypothetical protein